MSEEEVAAAAGAEGAEGEEVAEVDDGYSLSGSLIIYGIVADLLTIAPVIIYLLLDDTNGYASYHQSYINMLATAYAPLAIVWPSILFADCEMTRKAIEGVVQMAGLGPFALLWVGFFSFLMAAKATDKLKESDNTLFAVIYGAGNVLLIVLHWIFSGSIMQWLKDTPLPKKEEKVEEEAAEGGEEKAAEGEKKKDEDSGDGW